MPAIQIQAEAGSLIGAAIVFAGALAAALKYVIRAENTTLTLELDKRYDGRYYRLPQTVPHDQ